MNRGYEFCLNGMFQMLTSLSFPFCPRVKVYWEEAGAETGREDRARVAGVLLLPVSRQVQGTTSCLPPTPDAWHGPMVRRVVSHSALLCSQLPWICEKGLSVGHTRITTLGSTSMGEWPCLWLGGVHGYCQGVLDRHWTVGSLGNALDHDSCRRWGSQILRMFNRPASSCPLILRQTA